MPPLGDWVERLLQAQAANPKLIAAPLALLVFVMVAWRRAKYRAWPSAPECGSLISSSLGLYSGALIGGVLCFTNPPKMEYLSPTHQAIAGLYTLILTAYYTLPRIRGVFAPSGPRETRSVEKDPAPASEAPKPAGREVRH